MNRMNSAMPACIGIIPDGNRRWAKARGFLGMKGHQAGYKKFKEVAEWAFKAGVKTVMLYTFSTENWQRSREEVAYLMKLFQFVLKNELDYFQKNGIRLKIVGERSDLPKAVQTLAKKAEEETKENTQGTIVLLFSYGGRREIISAVRSLVHANASPSDITEKTFGRYLWTEDLPDPDLIIRTSGEMRLSNFLPWQSAYSELVFTKTLWPDFSKQEFETILENFGERERRFGK